MSLIKKLSNELDDLFKLDKKIQKIVYIGLIISIIILIISLSVFILYIKLSLALIFRDISFEILKLGITSIVCFITFGLFTNTMLYM